MKQFLLAGFLAFASCSGTQPSLRDVCRDVAVGATALDVLVDTLAATMDPHAPAQNVFDAIDVLDTKVQGGAEACALHGRRMRQSERLRRLLAARIQ